MDAIAKCTTAKQTRPNKIVSKPTIVTAEAPKVAEIISIIVAMEPKAKPNEASIESTSHKATSKDAIVVIIHTTSSGPTPNNFAPLEVVKKNWSEEYDWIGYV